ncbi:MAG: GAF domain-containing protein, partial [Anaerolineales bacterium]|nr:GAF domain-containing protein [Anaerolineales bacterium]
WQAPIPSNPLFERVLARATCYTTPHLQRDSADNLAPTAVRETGWHALAGIRMMANQRPIGLMLCLRANQRPFSETDLALLESVADQLGTTAVNDSLRQENNRLLVLEERHRLARELHDAVTHSLYSLTLFAETTNRFATAGDLEQVQHYTNRMKISALQSLREMRLLLHNLRPPSLSKLGLTGAIQHRLDAVEQRAGMAYTFFTDGDLEGLPTAVEDALWHVTEEALNNALKHSRATAVLRNTIPTDDLER